MAPAPAEFRLSLELADEAATARLAEDIAPMLRPGDLVALSGGLGVGKTSFARALIRLLAGDSSREVPSPTFPLRIDHALPRLTVAHADLYRVGGPDELLEIGLDDALTDAALLVEWPELLPAGLAENRLDIAFEISGPGRRAEVIAHGTWPDRLARTALIREFLNSSGWPNARRIPLVGDASVRAYERIRSPLAHPSPLLGGAGGGGSMRDAGLHPSPLPSPPPQGGRESAILMNSAARHQTPYDVVAHRALDVRPFVAIDLALRAAGVRAPKILAADLDAGLLLLEDLGSDGVTDSAGAPILSRYEAAIDLLAFMHGREWPDEASLPGGGAHRIPPYDRDALLIEISLFPDWYTASANEKTFSKAEREDFLATWSQILAQIEDRPKTWVLRDFHSPNILWQEGAQGIARVGVIDFQDALMGDPAYDAASLAQDARVPLTEADEERLKARYITARRANDPAFDTEGFDAAYAILAVQRATKVLGAFTRLAVAEGKPRYQQHRERLKVLIRRTLRHPVLSPLRVWYEPYL